MHFSSCKVFETPIGTRGNVGQSPFTGDCVPHKSLKLLKSQGQFSQALKLLSTGSFWLNSPKKYNFISDYAR